MPEIPMPIGVNLLPWRAQRDQRMRRRIWLAMPTAAIIGLGVMLVATLLIREMRHELLRANESTRQQITALADQRASAERLEAMHTRLRRRMSAMEQLLARRTTRLTELVGLVEALPPPVRLIRIERDAERMVIEGLAPDSASISALVNAVRTSPHFPELQFERLETASASERTGDRFRIEVRDASSPTRANTQRQGVGQ